MKKGNHIPAVLDASSPSGMGNPVAVAAVASVIPWGFLIKTAVLLGVGYYVINSFKKRFISMNEVERYGPANISTGEAKAKADAIHTAMIGLGNGFAIVRENIAGLNYNGWVKLYNAFGNREDSIPGNDDMNLVEWFMDQFDSEELNELRGIGTRSILIMEMTKPQKQTAIAITVVAALLIGYFVFIKKEDDSGYYDDPTGNNTDPNNQQAFNPALAAERLYDAMKESGTDENAVMAVFQNVSVSNFQKVFGKFGKRSYNTQLGNQLNFNPFYSLPLHPLNVWLKNELSASSYETLRIKYQSTNLL